jgi:hypothetical protein
MADLTQEELNRVVDPEVSAETFIFGTNNDAVRSPRTWLMKPLAYRYEKEFRKRAMPMLKVAYAPFETLMSSFGNSYVSGISPGIVSSIFDAEVAIDDYLEDSLLVILQAQDRTITKDWVLDNAKSRNQIFEIVMQQCALHHLMDRLGESLAERFGTIATTMGLNLDLPTLKQLWNQALGKLSAKIMTVVSTVDSVTGRFTEPSSRTGSLETIPEAQPKQAEELKPSLVSR